MIDPQLIKTDLEIIETNLKKRGLKIDLQNLKKLDEERREAKFESEKLRSDQKKLGKRLPHQTGMKRINYYKRLKNLVKRLKS